MKQLSFIPALDPDKLIADARAEHRPVASVCLFSGGNDSTVLAHRCREHYDSLAFIDTGTAVPGVRDFVESYAEWIGKPLRILDSGDAYRRVILGLDKAHRDDFRPFGFAGPAGHNRMYNAIKQPRVRDLAQALKVTRSDRVMFLTGIRRAESRRRRIRQPVNRDGGIVYVNPLIDWDSDQMRTYRGEHELPESDVAALLHKSGECNCGAYATADDRAMMQALFPEWWEAIIVPIEREAAAAGIRSCRWGEADEAGPPTDAGALCSDCQLRLEAV